MTYIKPAIRHPVLRLIVAALVCTFGLLGLDAAADAQPAPQRLTTTRLTLGIHVLQAELAQTTEERAVGLMNRSELGAQEGMLFVFEESGEQCFWMKNTLIPLSIAFLDANGTVLQINDMKPQSLDQHCSTKPVRFALEVTEGWFAKRGIRAGDRVLGTPFAH